MSYKLIRGIHYFEHLQKEKNITKVNNIQQNKIKFEI